MNRFLLPLLIVFSAVLHAGTYYPAKPGEAVVANEYLVRMKPGASAAQIVPGIVPGANIKALPALNIHKVKLPPGSSEADAGRIAAHPFVFYVEPNRIRKAVVAGPNDTSFSQQYALGTTQAVQAWGIMPNRYLTSSTAGSSRVTVAVIDTGVDCTHPDFINAGGTSTDSALGGQLSFSLSKAYATTTVPNAKCAWQDDFGHGTHVAGIVAAATNNNTGVASLGYPLQVAGYKGLDSSGSGDDATLSGAIMDAANAGIPILSASWGAAGYSQSLQNAIDYAWQRNTMIIAAAGNDGSTELFYPAGATHAFGVAATDSSNTPANFSNHGNDVSIAAPGVAILSTLPTYPSTMTTTTNYGVLSGTSMATPFVSALAGLLEMATPNASAAAVLQRIQQTAVSTNTNGGWDPTKGYGVISAYNALSGTVRTATTGALVGQVTDGGGVPVGSAIITVSGQSPVTADANGLYRVAGIPAGTYTVSITGGTFAAQNLSTTIAPGADTVLPVMMGVTYGRFTGTVKDAGVAVAGAIVQAITSGPLISATTVTDQTGTYTLWVPAGTYDVKASTLSAISGTVAAQAVTAGNVTTVNPTIARFGAISGTVRSGTVGLSGAQLKITGAGMTFGAVSDSNGNYHTIGLPAGTYTIDAAYGSSSDVIVNNVSVTLDTTTTENIQFQTAAPTATVQFLSLDSTTQGNWKAKYGVDGYTVVGNATLNPAYAAPSTNASQYVWTTSTTDVRALQKVGASDRIASAWYSLTNFSIALNFSDAATHQVAIYCDDWDNNGPRIQTIDVLDSNNNVLDTRTLSNFGAGQYLVWNISGHATIRATTVQGNAVIQGIFFGGAPASGPPTATVSFLSTDSTTQGNWKTKYGVEGYTVVGNATLNPTYVVPSTTASQYVWTSSTTDVRALQKVGASDRIAATWVSSTSFIVDLSFTDSATHQVAIYCLDWDNFGPRIETIDVLDSNNNVLDTHTLSSFGGGQYLVWNISGHARIRATAVQGNAVIEGIFFGGAPTVTAPTATATFLSTDAATQGNWKSKYGAEGYTVVGNAVLNPAYGAPSTTGSQYVWAASTTDVRALQKVGASDRIAATWFSNTNFTVDLGFTDSATHQVAIYCMDWDNLGPRIETIDVLDSNGTVLDTHTLSNFGAGQYLVWNISGKAKIRATTVQGNAVIEGIFFGGAVPTTPSATVTFVTTDTATQGSWKPKYGAEGYTVVGNATLNPSYVSPVSTASQYVWAASTTDVRALQKANASDRIAATWVSTTNFTIDLNFSDQVSHQVAIYCVDWDNFGPRIQTIDVIDSNGNVLDTHTLSSFGGGEYLVWNITGHVKIRATAMQGNAVIEGIFFGGAPPVPNGKAAYLTTDLATQGTWKNKYGLDGYTVVGDSTVNPSYVAPVTSASQYVWAGSTTDVRALQKAAAPDRIAATWYSSTSFAIDLNFTDANTHQIEVYCLDWDSFGPRIQTIDVLDANDNVLDTRNVSSFSGGQYLIWNVSGHVKIRATNVQGNAVIEGIFFR